MYIFKTCAAICENFVRDLLTFIHSNWKRTIKTPDFFNILSTFCHQFFKNSPKICPNREPFVNREPFSAGFSRLLNGFPPRGGNPSFAPKGLIFLASVLSLSPSFSQVHQPKCKKTQKNSLISSKLSNFTLISLLFSKKFFPEIQTIIFFSSNSLVFSLFVCLFVKLDTFTEKAQSIYSFFLDFQISH